MRAEIGNCRYINGIWSYKALSVEGNKQAGEVDKSCLALVQACLVLFVACALVQPVASKPTATWLPSIAASSPYVSKRAAKLAGCYACG